MTTNVSTHSELVDENVDDHVDDLVDDHVDEHVHDHVYRHGHEHVLFMNRMFMNNRTMFIDMSTFIS